MCQGVSSQGGKGLKEARQADYISDDVVVITEEGPEGGEGWAGRAEKPVADREGRA